MLSNIYIYITKFSFIPEKYIHENQVFNLKIAWIDHMSLIYNHSRVNAMTGNDRVACLQQTHTGCIFIFM